MPFTESFGHQRGQCYPYVCGLFQMQVNIIKTPLVCRPGKWNQKMRLSSLGLLPAVQIRCDEMEMSLMFCTNTGVCLNFCCVLYKYLGGGTRVCDLCRDPSSQV